MVNATALRPHLLSPHIIACDEQQQPMQSFTTSIGPVKLKIGQLVHMRYLILGCKCTKSVLVVGWGDRVPGIRRKDTDTRGVWVQDVYGNVVEMCGDVLAYCALGGIIFNIPETQLPPNS